MSRGRSRFTPLPPDRDEPARYTPAEEDEFIRLALRLVPQVPCSLQGVRALTLAGSVIASLLACAPRHTAAAACNMDQYGPLLARLIRRQEERKAAAAVAPVPSQNKPVDLTAQGEV